MGWVAGVAKCGTYGTIDDEELGGAGSAAAAAAAASADNFDIPALGLKDATRVLSDRVTELRQGRAMGTSGVVFSDEDLQQLRDEFDLADPAATGTITCGSLGSILTGLGMSWTDDGMAGLLEDIGATPETPLSFAEFVDIMALLSAPAEDDR